MLVRFNIPAGEVNWVRQPPKGDVELEFAAAGGGVVVSNAGQLLFRCSGQRPAVSGDRRGLQSE